MVNIRQENKWYPKYMLNTSENEWGLTDIPRLLSPSEGVWFPEVHSLHSVKTADKYCLHGKKEKAKGNAPFKNVKKKKSYTGNYILLVFFGLSMPHVIEFPVSEYKPQPFIYSLRWKKNIKIRVHYQNNLTKWIA